jgi:death-on-curing protein
MVVMPNMEQASETMAERERRRGILAYLAQRHHESLTILTAYDRDEVDRPRAQRTETRPLRGDPPDIVYLQVENALDAYSVLLGCTEERARKELRAPDRLLAALARPSMYAHYRAADLALRATALVHGIAEGQPFLDGNKRTAELAMTLFLHVNGFELDLAIEVDLAAWILDLSDDLSVEQLADLLRPWLVPVQ